MKPIRRKNQEREASPVSKHEKWFIPQNIMREVRFQEAMCNRRQKETFGKAFGVFHMTAWGCGCCVTVTEMTENALDRAEYDKKFTPRPRPKRRKELRFERDGKFTDINGKRYNE